MRRIFFLITIISLTLATSASALTWQGHAAYVLRNHHAKCHSGYDRATIKVKGKRTVGCVYHPPVTTTTTVPVTTTTILPVTSTTLPTPLSVTTTTTIPPAVPVVNANIDPSFTQSPSNPLDVTFTYGASAGATALPDGTVTLGIYVHASTSLSYQCTGNVTSLAPNATCEVLLSGFGKWDLSTTYSGGTNVSSTNATETVVIQPFAPTIALAYSGCNDSSSYCEITLPVTITNLIAGAPNGTISVVTTSGPTPITAQCPNLSAFSGTTATATCFVTLPKACQAQTWSGTLVFSGDSVYPNASANTDSYPVLAEPSLCPPQ